MTHDQERIVLAEAMGWKRGKWLFQDCWYSPDGSVYLATEYGGIKFDPFTDANDDYAVLEWMQNKQFVPDQIPVWQAFQEQVGIMQAVPANYLIGDYARAALKVLEKEDGS